MVAGPGERRPLAQELAQGGAELLPRRVAKRRVKQTGGAPRRRAGTLGAAQLEQDGPLVRRRQRPDPFAAALRGAKAAGDPRGLLNPGVLIDPVRA